MRPQYTLLALGLLAACGGVQTAGTPDSTFAPIATVSTTEPTTTSSITPLATAPPPGATNAPSTTRVVKSETTHPGVTVEPPSDATIQPPVPGTPIVAAAIADLRSRLDDPSAEVTVISVEEVDWPDGSLGCPQPGMAYTQAIVNGSKIVLMHAGIRYDYHQGGGRAPFYCAPGSVSK